MIEALAISGTTGLLPGLVAGAKPATPAGSIPSTSKSGTSAIGFGAPQPAPGGQSAFAVQAIAGDSPSNNAADQGLSDEEKEQVSELKATDREVRAHEAAHAATGGRYAGAPSYEFTTGPDGRQYAVAGEVAIDASPIAGDPDATIAKLQTVKRAALAPAQPSGQDRAVAAQAEAGIRSARAEKADGGEPTQLEIAQNPELAEETSEIAQSTSSQDTSSTAIGQIVGLLV